MKIRIILMFETRGSSYAHRLRERLLNDGLEVIAPVAIASEKEFVSNYYRAVAQADLAVVFLTKTTGGNRFGDEPILEKQIGVLRDLGVPILGVAVAPLPRSEESKRIFRELQFSLIYDEVNINEISDEINRILGSSRDIRLRRIVRSASPDVLVSSNNQLDVVPNQTFDKPIPTDDLIQLPIC
ncbi:MAG: hypothetical protein ACFE0R_13490 [Salinarimonas sp.]